MAHKIIHNCMIAEVNYAKCRPRRVPSSLNKRSRRIGTGESEWVHHHQDVDILVLAANEKVTFAP